MRKALAVLLTLGLLTGLLVVPAAAGGIANTRLSTGSHTAVIDVNGGLWMWGSNEFGQLGNGATGESEAPIKVLDNVVCVSCGSGHTGAVTADGALWMWGANGFGQLGNGGEGNAEGQTYLDSDIYYIKIQTVPVKVMDNVAAVSCGNNHTAVLTADGALWLSGTDANSCLTNGGDPFAFEKIMDGVAAVSCADDDHMAALKTDGTLWAWGYGSFAAPTQILDNVSAVCCGYFQTAAIRTDGTLWTRSEAVPGDGSETLVQVLDDVTAVSCQYDTIAAVKTDGTLLVLDGSAGAPTTALDSVSAVSCGTNDVIAVKADGTVWTWSDGSARQVPGVAAAATAAPAAPVVPAAPAVPTAYPSTQTVELDGKGVEFQCYALKDANGNLTNYIKLRDLALLLSGTAAQFDVGWDGAVTVTTGKAYTPNGTELKTPFAGERPYADAAAPTKVNGQAARLAAFVLTDDAGGGYTYYKLRDLGAALGFNVDWSADRGVFLETDKPYAGAN